MTVCVAHALQPAVTCSQAQPTLRRVSQIIIHFSLNLSNTVAALCHCNLSGLLQLRIAGHDCPLEQEPSGHSIECATSKILIYSNPIIAHLLNP